MDTSPHVSSHGWPDMRQGATRALVVKFADMKKPPNKGWMGTPSHPGGNGMRPGPGGYWQPQTGGGRDVYNKGREVYAGPYPYQVRGETRVLF